jgi:hypothetical protein
MIHLIFCLIFWNRRMISWLKSKEIIKYLYGENLHIELIKRSADILKFIAVECYMTKEYIDLLWQASLVRHRPLLFFFERHYHPFSIPHSLFISLSLRLLLNYILSADLRYVTSNSLTHSLSLSLSFSHIHTHIFSFRLNTKLFVKLCGAHSNFSVHISHSTSSTTCSRKLSKFQSVNTLQTRYRSFTKWFKRVFAFLHSTLWVLSHSFWSWESEKEILKLVRSFFLSSGGRKWQTSSRIRVVVDSGTGRVWNIHRNYTHRFEYFTGTYIFSCLLFSTVSSLSLSHITSHHITFCIFFAPFDNTFSWELLCICISGNTIFFCVLKISNKKNQSFNHSVCWPKFWVRVLSLVRFFYLISVVLCVCLVCV